MADIHQHKVASNERFSYPAPGALIGSLVSATPLAELEGPIPRRPAVGSYIHAG
jgi:hypothetical protein